MYNNEYAFSYKKINIFSNWLICIVFAYMCLTDLINIAYTFTMIDSGFVAYEDMGYGVTQQCFMFSYEGMKIVAG